MTDKQNDVLSYINRFINNNSFPPSYREIGEHFNIASTFGVKRHIDALIKKGYLNIDSNSNRSISLTDKALEIFGAIKENNSFEIPILGRVIAGYPVLSEQNIDGTLIVDSSLIKKGKKYFGLKVRGDSMIEDGIFENDTVIIQSQKTANNNEIIIAMVNNETTVKRFRKKNNQIELIPANKDFQNIKISESDDFKILGKVVGVYRFYN
ncbi:MAG: repressor LexA [Ignavibacteriae bacterium]|nr:MAG: repressor LexA [Ignavibacteriota bacterium]